MNVAWSDLVGLYFRMGGLVGLCQQRKLSSCIINSRDSDGVRIVTKTSACVSCGTEPISVVTDIDYRDTSDHSLYPTCTSEV